MRILVCASEAPLPPLNGMRLQLRELCARLAERHEVCVLAFRWPDQHGSAPAGVELQSVAAPVPGRAGRALGRAHSAARRTPVEAGGLAPPMARRVEALRRERQFDIAHVGLGQLAGVSPALHGLPAVLAPLDAWNLNVATEAEASAGARRVWLQLQERLVRRHVAHAYEPFARIVLVSEADERETLRLAPALRTAVIPNGVDAAHYRPGTSAERSPRLLVFSGALETPANAMAARWLATEIFPLVRERVPGAELALVGRAPGLEVRELARLPGVSVEADVADMRTWLVRAAVFTCAMTGGTGMKNKLLEAMACGAPCVATPLACQGLDVQDGRQLLVAAEAAAFADAIVRVLEDPALAARLGEHAREHAVAQHSWDAVARRYEEVYAEILGG